MLAPAAYLALASGLIAGPLLETPWACGDTYSCTQGNGGQTSHTGIAQYAWDFGMPVGTDILAAKGGTVLLIKINSNVGGCSNAYANDANYVVIDHGDGTAGLYLHVDYNSSNLQVGDPVETGEVIARVGETGWTCGPHLHFQVQEICGSWWCQSVPAEFFAAGVIAYPEQTQSENCGPCLETLDGGQTTISEDQVQCFDRLTKWWFDANEGLDGHHWFTYATAAAEAGTIGRWRFAVDVPGDYQVEVHIPSGNADSTAASYRIHHAGQVDEVGLDQAGQKGWQSHGTFDFDGLGDELLELPDNTGEPEGDLVPLAYDSVRFTYVGGGDGDGDTGDSGDGDGDPTTGDGDGDPTTGDGDGDCPLGQPGCMCTPGGGCDPGAICIEGYCTPDNSMDSGEDGGSDSTTGGGTGPIDNDDLGSLDEGACACTSTPAGGPADLALGLLLLAGVAGVRRRR